MAEWVEMCSARQVMGSIPQVASNIFLKISQGGIRSRGQAGFKYRIRPSDSVATFLVVTGEPSSAPQHAKGSVPVVSLRLDIRRGCKIHRHILKYIPVVNTRYFINNNAARLQVDVETKLGFFTPWDNYALQE